MDELTIGDQIYISSKKAAQITGYAKDYVGQLCREGHVEARMVGRNWYVLESSIRAHRFGAPAKESVGATEPLEEKSAPIDAPVATPETTSAAVSDALATWKAPTYAVESPTPIPELTPRRSINILDAQAPAPVLTDMQSAWHEWFQSRTDEALLESPEVIDARDAHVEEEVAAIAQEEVATPVISEDLSVNIRKIADQIDQEDASAPATPSATVSATRPSASYASNFDAIRASWSQPVATVAQAPTEAPHMSAAGAEALEEGAEQVLIHRGAAPAKTVDARTTAKGAGEGMTVRSRSDRKSAVKDARKARKEAGKASHAPKGGGSLPLRALLLAVMLLVVAATIIGSGYADRYIPTSGPESVLTKYLGGTRTINK